MLLELGEHQLKAIDKMHNGCILYGDVGTGKSRTALGYYYVHEGGNMDIWKPLEKRRSLYIITTARKRDTCEWEEEMVPFGITAIVDSWNNIQKYIDITDAFFIFDEQRLVGNGPWVNSFLKIAKNNLWILLSATPGDKWIDYLPVFMANGYFKNRSEFIRKHVVYKRWAKYPNAIDRYVDIDILTKIRNEIMVPMIMERHTIQHHEDIICPYNIDIYKKTIKTRWNYRKDKPIETISELCYELRRISNNDSNRIDICMNLARMHNKLLIFYNFDYELELLKESFNDTEFTVEEWNGHTHHAIPFAKDKWIYLVQYTAGAEGWNCTYTNAMIFFSQSYSYKTMVQAAGRIDRANTPFKDLYYYHLKSKSPIDIAISRALKNKKQFNESSYGLKFVK